LFFLPLPPCSVYWWYKLANRTSVNQRSSGKGEGRENPGPGTGKTARGKAGEDRAAAFLEGKGMKIIARNVRVPGKILEPDPSPGQGRLSLGGEIDIIALEGDTILFVEVKNWSRYGIDALEQGIDKKKQRRIIETAKYFLSQNREYRYMAVRFDIIFIAPRGLTHLASAFTEYI
jgi:putative endonuclease